jgi:cytochrome c-type biogenesis protein CcmH
MRAVVAILLALALLALPQGAAAAEPRASLPDIEDEVMCLECGTALNVSTSAVADQEREFIAELIAQGKTKAEIKEALVAEYGPRVLAEPQDEGFQLTAWIVPVLAALGALALVVLIARRWRRRDAGAATATATADADPGLDADDARRLDAELAAFDR